MNPSSPPTEERILEVLAHWEELRQRGQEVPVEMLCRDCPELIAGVKRAIDDLLAWQPLLDGPQAGAASEGGTPNSCSVAGPPTGPFERRAEDTRGLPERLGDYRILREVGRGGMGVVYEAVQESLGRHVALKILPFHRLMDPTHFERFRREARAAAQLHHTNIVPVFGVGEAEGIHYYAMQFIHGQGLDAVLEEVRRLRLRKNRPEHDGKQTPRDLSVSIAQGLLTGHFQEEPACTGHALAAPEVVGLPPSLPGAAKACRAAGAGSGPEPATTHGHSELASQTEAQYCRSVARVGVQVAEALAYAHRQRILHRDIKPSNLLLDTQGTVWITDFGLAKAEGSEELTSPGDIVGTVRFMAPERFGGQADRRSDLYSLGITLYEMLTLRPAFADSHRARLVERVTHEEPARPRKLDPHIPPDLDTIVMKAIAKDPSDRYDRAEELAEDLRRFLNGRPIQARPVGQVERLIRWCRRNPGLAGALGAAALFLLLGTIVSSFLAVQALGQAQRADMAAGIAAENERLVREAKRDSDHRNYASEMKLASLDAEAGQMGFAKDRMDFIRQRLGENEPQGAGGPDLRGFEWYYLQRLGQLDLRTLRGHKDVVWGVAYSPDGRRIASGSWDKTVKVWDAAGGQELLKLEGHTGLVSVVAYSPDGRRLASGSWDKTVRVWDAASGQELATLKGHTQTVRGVAFSPDGRRLASASVDGTVKVWDAASGQEIVTLKGHTDDVFAVAYSPDGRRLASAGEDWKVKVWDAATGHELLTLKGHTNSVRGLAYSPDGRRLATASEDQTVKVWDAATGKFLRTLEGHTGRVYDVAYNPDGRRLATAGGDQTVKVWDLSTGQVLRTLKGHTGEVFQVAYSPDGRCLASASRDRTVKVWDAASSQECLTLKGHTSQVSAIAYSPDGRRLASASYDGTLKVWDAASRRELCNLVGHTHWVLGVGYSPDGRCLASASRDGTVKVWDAVSGKYLRTLKGHRDAVLGVAYSPDGRCLASASYDKNVKLWDAATGKCLRTLEGHKHRVTCVAYSPDGRCIASGSYDQTVKVWEAASGQELLTLKAGQVWGVAFSPDGRRLASAGWNGTVKVWDADTGDNLLTLNGHTGGAHGVGYSPDSRRLASASFDGTVKLWDAATGQELLTLKGHPGGAWGVAFSPNGRCLASAGADGTVKLWDATPLTAQRLIEREARGLVQFLLAKPQSPDEAAAAIRRDPTITEAVRQEALAWVELLRRRRRPQSRDGCSALPGQQHRHLLHGPGPEASRLGAAGSAGPVPDAARSGATEAEVAKYLE